LGWFPTSVSWDNTRALDFARRPVRGRTSDPIFSDDLTKLANAFTRRGLVKRFWNLNGSEAQPSGPASPEAGTELTPRGSSEPTTAFWEIEPVETDPPVGRRRLAPCR